MIDKEKIKHLALLARLNLSEEEIERLTSHLKRILEYVEKINELNLDNEPLINLMEKQDLREDEVEESENKNKIINNFPQKDGNYLRVPKIL